jgi:hypothetical protein
MMTIFTHSHRVIYFPGHDENGLLTHFYSMMYFADPAEEYKAKRFARDRMKYLDDIYCAAGKVVQALGEFERPLGQPVGTVLAPVAASYVAFHIRRGEFQQTHTRWEAAAIIGKVKHLIPDSKDRIVYISTDEHNSSFFTPFKNTFKKVFFLADFYSKAGLSSVNQNHIGMVEQIICANAYTFIGTPLSTFSSYITRQRGFYNNTSLRPFQLGREPTPLELSRQHMYTRTYYYMQKQMYQLHEQPHLVLPFWVREFVEAFENIDIDDL